MRRVENVLRHSALVVAIIAVFACVTAASASAAPLLWTANHDSESVSTINTATSEVVGNSIPVGEFPNSIAMTPNGRQAFVATSGGEDITAINTATRTATSISAGEAVERVAVSPDGRTAYFTTEGSEKVFVIDTATDT